MPTESMVCPVCSGSTASEILRIRDVPVFCNVLYDSADNARSAPRADIAAAFCPQCNHLFNAEFDPTLVRYAPGYENSLHFSPLFREYADTCAATLVERYGLRDKTIVEAGCGDGDFLRRICRLGNNRGFGFDPSGKEGREESITYIRDYFSSKYMDCRADFICCRHVLEHIDTPIAFMETIREALKAVPGSAAYIEVPNVEYTLRDRGIWDLIYEHCNYYSGDSLRYLCERCGLDVRGIAGAYGGQFLGIEVTSGNNHQPLPASRSEALPCHAGSFAREYERKVLFWSSRLIRLRKTGRDLVLWGAGSKGATFLNVLGATGVHRAVDVNPRKLGRFIAGTGHQIVSPEQIGDLENPVVVVMNPQYREEVAGCLRGLGIRATILTA